MRYGEYIEVDGDVYSWYCTVCGLELGADLDNPRYCGEPANGCPEHGKNHIAWETWNVESEPTYPHRVVDL